MFQNVPIGVFTLGLKGKNENNTSAWAEIILWAEIMKFNLL